MQHQESDSEDLEDDTIPEEIVKKVENFENKPKSNLEETEAINLGDPKTVKETHISIHLSSSEKEEYVRFLKEYEDIFSWSYDDMTGLRTSIVAQKLPTNPMCPPVKRKLRKYKSDMSLKIKEEVTKQIKSKVLRVVEYPTWLANIVPVSKEDGKVRAVKGQALDGHLAENPVYGEDEPLKTYFPNKEVTFVGEDIVETYDGWRMFFYRATNFKGVGIRAVLVSEIAQHYSELLVIGDSDLLVHKVLGEWSTKNTKILSYLHCVQELIKRFTKIEFKYVPRIQNEFADVLATLSSMIQHPDKNFIDPILIEIRKQPAYCARVEEEFDGNLWFHYIKEYLEKGEYPYNATHTQKRMLRRLTNHLFRSGGILYRRTPNLGLLRCVDAKEASRWLKKIYAGTCGPRMNGFVLAKKILRARYFWMTMEIDCIKHVRKCHQCQVHADMIRVPANELNATSSPLPFFAWGMDVIGPTEIAASNGHKFILMAIDYFTKWVEAASYKAVTKKVVADFLRDRIVCRINVLESIITDNAANLNSDLMKEMCEKFKIKHRNSTAYRPQMNGVVEAANKNIKKILRKMVDNYKKWHEKLPFAFLGYRTTVHMSTGGTPYLLVYGT
ncbi:uncharacterized protein [Nicotiana tomentosiformis]|uniref:uncharacterized protein n=1 Tax=Nicotiana tomentosiformis TaxID=4098 RepID=UPI00388CD1B3